MTDLVARIVAELRERLEGIYGDRLEHVVLFGSQARGDADPESDIDVLVVLRGEVSPVAEIRRTGEMVAELSLRRDVDVGLSFISAERFDAERSPFIMNVRREGVSV